LSVSSVAGYASHRHRSLTLVTVTSRCRWSWSHLAVTGHCWRSLVAGVSHRSLLVVSCRWCKSPVYGCQSQLLFCCLLLLWLVVLLLWLVAVITIPSRQWCLSHRFLSPVTVGHFYRSWLLITVVGLFRRFLSPVIVTSCCSQLPSSLTVMIYCCH